jgi:hypothetical protein
MSNWGKIAIGTRLGHIDPAFFVSWTALLLAGLRPGDRVLNPAVGLPHSCACDFLCNQFIDTDCDSLLFVDDDMQFTPADLEQLRSSGHEYDILSALYCCRRMPHRPIVLDGVGPCGDDGKVRPLRVAKELRGVMPVLMSGLGFTLIKRWVIREVQKQNAPHIFVFDPDEGEDGHFCQQARDAGAKVAVNTDVCIGHRVSKTVYFEDGATVIGDNSFCLDTR